MNLGHTGNLFDFNKFLISLWCWLKYLSYVFKIKLQLKIYIFKYRAIIIKTIWILKYSIEIFFETFFWRISLPRTQQPSGLLPGCYKWRPHCHRRCFWYTGICRWVSHIAIVTVAKHCMILILFMFWGNIW